MDYQGLKQILVASRGSIVRLLDDLLFKEVLTGKERDVLYSRLIEWNSLERVGKEFMVTRERIRQIEAKAEEKIRCYEKRN